MQIWTKRRLTEFIILDVEDELFVVGLGGVDGLAGGNVVARNLHLRSGLSSPQNARFLRNLKIVNHKTSS